MKISQFHPWDVTPQQAVRIQEEIRGKVLSSGRVPRPTLVAGADAAFDLESSRIFAAVVVLSFPEMEPVETVIHRDLSNISDGNGCTIGIAMTPEQADAWHAAGVEAGGTAIEDPPGVRGEGTPNAMYLAYLRDPDGNKLCALHRMG